MENNKKADANGAEFLPDVKVERAKSIVQWITGITSGVWAVPDDKEFGHKVLLDLLEILSDRNSFGVRDLISELQFELFHCTRSYDDSYLKWKAESFKSLGLDEKGEILNEETENQPEHVLDLSAHPENLNLFDAEALITKYELPKEVEQALRDCAKQTEVKK